MAKTLSLPTAEHQEAYAVQVMLRKLLERENVEAAQWSVGLDRNDDLLIRLIIPKQGEKPVTYFLTANGEKPNI